MQKQILFTIALSSAFTYGMESEKKTPISEAIRNNSLNSRSSLSDNGNPELTTSIISMKLKVARRHLQRKLNLDSSLVLDESVALDESVILDEAASSGNGYYGDDETSSSGNNNEAYESESTTKSDDL